MSTTLLVILVAIGVVGFFMLGMSLTLIFKGHNIDSEISTNKEMQKRGIKCAIQQQREIDAQFRAKNGTPDPCNRFDDCTGNCGSCSQFQQ